MKRKGLFVLAFLVCLNMSMPIFGQEKKVEFGFFAGIDRYTVYTEINSYVIRTPYIYRIGAMIEPVPKILIKPDLIIRTYQDEVEDHILDTSYTEREASLFGGGLSLLYTIAEFQDVLLYLGPRAELMFYKDMRYREDGSQSDQDNCTAWSLMGCVAGQYLFNDNFRIFAEVGLGYAHRTEEEVEWNTSGDVTGEYEKRYPDFFSYGGQVGFAFYF